MNLHPFATRTGGLRRTAPVGLTAVAALVLAACGASDGDASGTAGEPFAIDGTTVKVDAAARGALPADVRDAGAVKVATDVPYAPFEMFEEEGSSTITGVDHDLGQAIGAKLGIDLRFSPQKFDGIIPAIQAGTFDVVMSAMTDSKERQAALTFVDYSASGTGILVAKGNPEGISSYLDLCGQKVGAQSGSSQVELAQSWAKECESSGAGGIDLQQFPKDSDAQLAIKSGKVVASLLTKPSAGYVAKTAGGGDAFESIDDPKAPTGYDATPNGIGVDKRQPELAKAIQKALQSLMDDGTYDKILAKYGVEGIAVDEATINIGSK